MGAITTTSKGIIHHSGRGFYSGAVAESGNAPVNASTVKRGRGRPRKDSGATGTGFNFGPLIGDVKIPKWTGPSTFVQKLGE